MRWMLTERVRDEIRRFRLAFCCDECQHFVAADEKCDLLYPTEPHRRRTYERAVNGEPLVFCKMFEAD